jgi:hypothetical protein
MYKRILVPLNGSPFTGAVLLRAQANPVIGFSFLRPSIAESAINDFLQKLEAAGFRASFLIHNIASYVDLGNVDPSATGGVKA